MIFDKTRTLTRGEPSVTDVISSPTSPAPTVLRWAASAELPSEHPLAQAIVAAARAQGLPLIPPTHFEARPGRGVLALVEGRRVVVGTLRLLEEEGISASPVLPLIERAQAQGQTVVLVAVDGQAVGVLALADPLKPDAQEALQRLRHRGVTPVLLTGDNRRTAQAVAATLGIERVMAEVLPDQKAAAVRWLQAQGHRVAMVGDGINDAPALMQADVGVAIGAGTDIAIEAADVVLVGERLSALVEAWELARWSYRLTATNVALALAFNGIGVLASLTGMVYPAWAMLAMAVSVSVVLANSLAKAPKKPWPALLRQAL